ncbi:MFS transporter [Kribbella jiaozuonensis]|uniref:MFS transporter n=1 Tax=Kribbella jiaozuonensis TaxID=2575441 RepID=A0A4U3M2W2_9ACTN|nr:MFS transporter [Kribbella jiaozuonensis]TKK82389.1 MFS transporter [Kribbella jiaozuonensis]
MTSDAERADENRLESLGETVEAPPSHRWWALAVIAIAQLMVVLDGTVVTIALPSAQRDLGISDADRQWVVTAYTVAFGGLLLLGGRIADYTGRKRMFLVGLLGFAAASALGGAAQNGATLFGARALQGAFAALLAPAALSLVSVTFTELKERSRAFAVYGAISGGGSAIGLILGGTLTEYASWRWCLLINVPIAIAAFIAGTILVTESKSAGGGSYDIPGAILGTAGLVALVYGFTQAAKTGVGWLSIEVIGYLVGAVILLVAFVLVELRTTSPLLPMRVVLDRNRGGSYLASLLVFAGLFAMFLFLSYYFQYNLGYSALKSGIAFLPFSIGIIVTSGAVSAVLPRTGPKPLMLIGLAMVAIGLGTFTFISDNSSWAPHVLPGELLMSIGLGLVIVPLSSLALTGVNNNDAGVASAVLNSTQQIGGSLGTALLNTFYASAVTSYVVAHHLPPSAFNPPAAIHGYHVAFWIGAAMITAAFVAVLLLVKASKDDISTQPDPESSST